MTVSFMKLANKSIRTLKAYQPGKPIEEVQRELGIQHVIKLASNENPLGASPKALAAIQQYLTKICLKYASMIYRMSVVIKPQIIEQFSRTSQASRIDESMFDRSFG